MGLSASPRDAVAAAFALLATLVATDGNAVAGIGTASEPSGRSRLFQRGERERAVDESNWTVCPGSGSPSACKQAGVRFAASGVRP